ncbi:hypothetical protein HJG60_011152 [Phyllostomus discolor]|uniref:Matrin-type domain-containing protein n=1 Tax=Phyllostomus discolor TaxID=89673 RepID=A0A834A777_9CHIR|nr:hypothetical protein HJG60_011152 [Phyllostomus discolor]
MLYKIMTRSFPVVRNWVANGLQNNMPRFYCDHCDTHLTHDSPSVRKTHCSGRKHMENVKDYCQKRMEEQAQSLINTTTTALQLGEIPPTPFSAPPPSCRANDSASPQPSGSSSPWDDASTPYGGPSHDASDGSSSSWVDASGTCSGMRPPVGGHMPMMPGPPVM